MSSFLEQELDSAPSGAIIVSFGTMWLPDDETMAAVLTALAKSPVKVIMKSPSKKQRPFNEECNNIINNASNIVMVSWLPKVSKHRQWQQMRSLSGVSNGLAHLNGDLHSTLPAE